MGYRWDARSLIPPDARSTSPHVSSLAWAIAAADLGIRVTAPFSETDRFGKRLDFIARVHDFGSRAGTLVWYMPAPLPTAQLESGTVYFVSALNPALYAEYDRSRFIALLTGWGWSGSGQPPEWYDDL